MPRTAIIVAYLAICGFASAAADSKNILRRSELEGAPGLRKYLKLRNDYAESFSGGWFVNPERRSFMKLYESDKAAFLERSRDWLGRCPIDAKVHMMRALLLTDPRDAAEKRYHKTMFFGLMDSLFRTRDGKTCHGAYYAININEEYMLLNAIGAKPLGHKIHNNCDVFDVERDGRRTTVTFTMSKWFAAKRNESD